MSLTLIHQYYRDCDALKRVSISNEMAIVQPFNALVRQIALSKHYIFATEVTIKNDLGKNIRPDGILMNDYRLPKGYVESKDTDDTLDAEIDKKIYKAGYPKTNIIFQDSVTAVLIQNGDEVLRAEMRDPEALEKILLRFINYKPDYIVEFEQALVKFREDIPTIVETLRHTIDGQYKTNADFKRASESFFEMCRKEINPQISHADVREMIIQHILTEDLFRSVFDESDFHHENNIAAQLENLVNTFMNRTVRQNQLAEIGHYYQALNAQASKVSDHHEKQKFLKVVYENFYKVYNPKGADKLGVVYTPNEIVRFMVESTDYLLQKHFNKSLSDRNVHILDPATGTGTFVTDIIDFIPAQYLEHKYRHELYANEVAILPYYIANLNIEYTYKQKMKQYVEFPNSCFVDTLDNIDGLSYQGKQHSMFAFSSENAERIQRQNEQKISVIIGNPPYNANQASFNDFNKNREYPDIDKRIKNTYVKYSSAQKTKVYDMYARFYRWASDRLNDQGILAFITNRSFIDSRTFDGFRKVMASEFSAIYIVDLGGDVRANPKLSGTKHNVFGIQTGVAIMILVRNRNTIFAKDPEDFEKLKQDYYRLNEPVIVYEDQRYFIPHCRISYYRRPEFETSADKLDFLKTSRLWNLPFENIQPDQNNNWIQTADNDFETLLPVAGKKEPNAIFAVYSNGVSTNRDEWVFDFDKKNLEAKAKFLSERYNQSVKEGAMPEDIKWSRDLRNKALKKIKSKFDRKLVVDFNYRPFTKLSYYSEKIFSDVLTQNHVDYFGKNFDIRNKVILFCGKNHSQPFHVMAVNRLFGLDFLEKTQSLPLYRHETKDSKIDNITQNGLKQFRTHYRDERITREDIFHYTYAVLHDPVYRKKYEANLRREFPRLPFYPDFFKWVAWGKQLMGLHIDYEDASPYPLKLVNLEPPATIKHKLKVKLKADKVAHTIELDENTKLLGIPAEAWDYKLGNRSALEWVLDQYKEKKPSDKTIAEKFSAYKFADYKPHVIKLLAKVTTVSIDTMSVVNQMASFNR